MVTRAQLFGSPTIECDGTVFAAPFERRSQLVVWLALRRDWVGRAELAALLWPDLESKLAHSNLRKTLFRLRGLTWSETLETQGNLLRYLADTDVDAFERALGDGRTADDRGRSRGTRPDARGLPLADIVTDVQTGWYVATHPTESGAVDQLDASGHRATQAADSGETGSLGSATPNGPGMQAAIRPIADRESPADVAVFRLGRQGPAATAAAARR